MQRSAGVRELKARLSHFIRSVKEGESVVVTEHGTPVARIVPFSAEKITERLGMLKEQGLIAWGGGRLAPHVPVTLARAEGSVADLLLDDRLCSSISTRARS